VHNVNAVFCDSSARQCWDSADAGTSLTALVSTTNTVRRTGNPVREADDDTSPYVRNARKPLGDVGFPRVLFVAGAGFEPATFGL
jgi:hypothetical protein